MLSSRSRSSVGLGLGSAATPMPRPRAYAAIGPRERATRAFWHMSQSQVFDLTRHDLEEVPVAASLFDLLQAFTRAT